MDTSGRPKTVARLEGCRAHYRWGRGSKLPWRGTSGADSPAGQILTFLSNTMKCVDAGQAARRSYRWCNPPNSERRQNATEMVLAKNDDVVQALSTEGSDKALRIGILPRGTGRGQDFLDVHAFDSSMEYLTVDPVTVADLGRRVLGKCLDDLLSSPGRAWPRPWPSNERRVRAGGGRRCAAYAVDSGSHPGRITCTSQILNDPGCLANKKFRMSPHTAGLGFPASHFHDFPQPSVEDEGRALHNPAPFPGRVFRIEQ